MTNELLFDESIIPDQVKAQLLAGHTIRPLARGDHALGVLEVLSVLTTVGHVSHDKWNELFDFWKANNTTYFIIVILAPNNRIVACGTVMLERKLIHECGIVGHIEDIAVDRQQQGKRLGLRIIDALTQIAHSQGVYKVILDCSEKNVPFYEKCGYQKVAVQMDHRIRKAHF